MVGSNRAEVVLLAAINFAQQFGNELCHFGVLELRDSHHFFLPLGLMSNMMGPTVLQSEFFTISMRNLTSRAVSRISTQP